jgi:hypothetical protein
MEVGNVCAGFDFHVQYECSQYVPDLRLLDTRIVYTSP